MTRAHGEFEISERVSIVICIIWCGQSENVEKKRRVRSLSKNMEEKMHLTP